MRTYRGWFVLPVAALLLITACKKTDGQAKQGAMKTESASMMAEGWTLENAGLQTPESVLWDPGVDLYYVSNLGGPQPLEKDGNGFISKVGPDGKMLELKWIDGMAEGVELNAPKGMARYGDFLLVGDIDVLRAFKVETGEHEMDIPLPGATFANDVSAGKGIVYVTDTGANGPGAVYIVKFEGFDMTPRVETLVRDAALTNPNGILEDHDKIWMVPYGGTGVFKLMNDGSFEVVATAPTGALDGVIKLKDGRLAFSSWEGKAVYVMDADHSISTLFSDVESPADIGYDAKRNLVLIPLFMKDTIVAKPVG